MMDWPEQRARRPQAETTDVVDACVTERGLRRRDLVISSDPEDLKALAAAVNRHLEVERP